MVCRKCATDRREELECDTAFERAVVRARLKIARLEGKSLELSLNDRRVVLISQFLVEVCPRRSAEQVLDALERKVPELDVAARDLLESGPGSGQSTAPISRLQTADAQLMLFDAPRRVESFPNPSDE